MERARKDARLVANIDLTLEQLKISLLVVGFVKLHKELRADMGGAYIFSGGLVSIFITIELWGIQELRRATKMEQEPLIANGQAKNWRCITVTFGVLAVFSSFFLGGWISIMYQIIMRGSMLLVVGDFISELEKVLKVGQRHEATTQTVQSSEEPV